MPKSDSQRIIDLPYQQTSSSPLVATNTVLVAGATNHNSLSGLTVGDPHTQYLPVSGSRAMTGNLDMGGNDITNIGSITGLAPDDAQYVVLSTDATLSAERILTAGDGIDLSDGGAGGNVTLAVDVTDFIDTSYGLTESSNNIRVNLDANGALEFNTGAMRVKLPALSGMVRDSTGLRVGAGDGIDVLATTIAVDVTDFIDLNYGLTESANNIRVNLAANSGLQFWSGALGLGTPGTLSATSTNNLNGTAHTHAITTSSNPGVAQRILASTTAGGLTLESFQSNGSITALQSLYAGESGFRVIHHTHDYDHVHVVINPTGSWSLDEQFGLDVDDNLLVRGYIVGKHAIQIPDASLIAHFDGPEPYWSNVDGTATGHLGQVPEYVYAKSFKAGKFGKALAVSRPSTNYIANSCFRDVNGNFLTSNWNNWSSTFSDGGVDNRFFGRILRAISDGSGAEIYAHIPQAARQTTGTYYFSFWARANESRTVRAQLKHVASPYTVVDYEDISLTTEWQHFSVALTNTSGNDAIRPFLSNWSNQDNGDWIEIAEVQFELGQQTAYFNGSFGEYFAWDGADWETASHRNDRQTVLYRNMDQFADVNRGSIMLWIYSLPTGDNDAYFIGNGAFSTSRLRIRHYASEIAYMYIGDSGQVSMGTMPYGQWNHVAITWESDGGSGGTGTANAYVNGIQVVTDYAYDNMNSFEDRALFVGRLYSSSTYTANGYVDDLVIVRRAMTGDEIRAVYESNAPVFAETSTFHWRAGRNRVWADAEGLWAIGASGNTILGLYAGDDNNPAATKSWGGVNLSEGDVLIGSAAMGYMHVDHLAEEISILLRNSGTDTLELSAGAGLSFYGAPTGAQRYHSTNYYDSAGVKYMELAGWNESFGNYDRWGHLYVHGKSGAPDANLTIYANAYNADSFSRAARITFTGRETAADCMLDLESDGDVRVFMEYEFAVFDTGFSTTVPHFSVSTTEVLCNRPLGLTATSQIPSAPASGARLYVSSGDGDLYVKFANGTTVKLASN